MLVRPERDGAAHRQRRGGSVSTSAAAPSETSEQSVRFSGPATNGFFSLSCRQKSKPKSLRICA